MVCSSSSSGDFDDDPSDDDDDSWDREHSLPLDGAEEDEAQQRPAVEVIELDQEDAVTEVIELDQEEESPPSGDEGGGAQAPSDSAAAGRTEGQREDQSVRDKGETTGPRAQSADDTTAPRSLRPFRPPALGVITRSNSKSLTESGHEE